MKTHLLFIVRLYVTYIVAFILIKPVFMLYNSVTPVLFSDILQVIRHGLIMDCSVAGYLIIIPLLLILLSVWLSPAKWWKPTMTVYFAFVALVLSVIFISDCALYPFWQFKLNAMALSYMGSLKGAVDSVSTGFVIAGTASVILFAGGLFFIQYVSLPTKTEKATHRILLSIAILILGVGAFIGIRGGFGKSTMNVGTVYFSDVLFLNHSAVNPAFSLFYSSLKAEDFDRMYRFFPEDKADQIFQEAHYSTLSHHTDSLLNTTRPNILLVIIEGFGGSFTEHIGKRKNITPNFDRLIDEGVFFSHFYANSYRTDRGLVSILSGYPAFPETSVLQYPDKCQNLGAISSSLLENNYSTEFIYGGDINFKNIKGYLLSNGYQRVFGDTHFPSEIRTSHAWGVTDVIVFDTVYQRITHKPSQPWFSTFLTLASHEPWIVPFQRNGLDKVANSMAYVDHCIGNFVDKIKHTPLWDNLLLIFLPDHGIGYPEGVTVNDIQRYHVPMLWLGGAVREPRTVNKICNQTDLVATLLGQMNISHASFPFSRDVMSKDYRQLAVYMFNNGFTVIDSTGYTSYDLNSSKTIKSCPLPSSERMKMGKTLLQKYIEDFASR